MHSQQWLGGFLANGLRFVKWPHKWSSFTFSNSIWKIQPSIKVAFLWIGKNVRVTLECQKCERWSGNFCLRVYIVLIFCIDKLSNLRNKKNAFGLHQNVWNSISDLESKHQWFYIVFKFIYEPVCFTVGRWHVDA